MGLVLSGAGSGSIQSGTSGVAVQMQDSASNSNTVQAWVNFNGTSGTRNASFNVSSVTRNSTGNYTINFTNAFSDTNYSTNWTVSANSGNAFGGYESQSTARTTTAVTLLSMNTSSGAASDCTLGSVSIFR